MGEDLEVEGRMAVRTPMQWSSGRNGGFSSARPGRLVRRVTPDGYGPDHVNVADQRRDPDSLWTFMHRLIQAYRTCPELGWAGFEELEQPLHEVFAHRSTWEGGTVVTVHNLSGDAVTVEVQVEDHQVGLADVLEDGGTLIETDEQGRLRLPLDGYGYRWLRVRTPGEAAEL